MALTREMEMLMRIAPSVVSAASDSTQQEFTIYNIYRGDELLIDNYTV